MPNPHEPGVPGPNPAPILGDGSTADRPRRDAPTRGTGNLVVIRLPAPQAAIAIRYCWDQGDAVLPLDPSASQDSQDRLLWSMRPTHVLGAGESVARKVPGGIKVSREVAAVVATSGTTSEPKGVELTWSGLAASCKSRGAALGSAVDAPWLCGLPLHHVGGLGVLARGWFTGVEVRVIERLDSDFFAGSQFDPTWAQGALTIAVPTLLARLLDGKIVGGSTPLAIFRAVLVGGAPIPFELLGRARDAGVRVVTTYGLTETWGGVVHDGKPVPGVGLKIASDADGAIESIGEGQIFIRGDMVMRGYRNPTGNQIPAESSRGTIDEQGWLATGDLGHLTADGKLVVTDRMGDLVISGGTNVSPSQVELALGSHPKVKEVCICGEPDPDWGERVVAYVVPIDADDPPTLEELRELAKNQLSGPDAPRKLMLVEAIPRTASGKPLRRILATENS